MSATAEALALRCEGCGAELQLAAGLRTANCPYCASPAVVERPIEPGRPDPTFVLGFVVTQKAALEHARKWIRRPLFAPSEFRRADVSEVRGVYVPAYLYTAAARAEYAAEIGENYTVTETYTTTDAKGRTVTRTRTRTVTEWRDLSGTWSAYVDDVLVTASRGLANGELARIEPFDLRALRQYSPKILSGWIAEDPSLHREACTTQAREEALESVGTRIGRHMPGDKHRGLQHRTSLSHEDLELLLLPVWVLAVRYRKDKPPVRLIVNGQSGKLFGKAPLSWPKIVITVLVVLAAIAGAVWASS